MLLMVPIAPSQSFVLAGYELSNKPGPRVLVSLQNYRALQADEPLASFMDFCTYGHMIDNVVLIVTGTLHERDVQVKPCSPYQLYMISCWQAFAVNAPTACLVLLSKSKHQLRR